ncbi:MULTISPECIES: carbohydrate ABC transporter permease [Cellulomonas]|jgi:multiple sugar transport system permease protein/raffinose/stachyose/melibiose transport system permease protein|uniref:Multiple sugar transport system permease protein/raffinose/stachyose/melibiose transport system permease protein n=1 Tax=Cellulomonas iranensis TaxID=76862 RepID=A0ABU0GHW1_9CELL|nr:MULTISPECIES: sugar ABC transporter permease [Cellulomonas]MDQ0424177.1 multiple sugar transport system permease protein/raffinose/stachyose/melibiose transport system permease protein [Cellulomonas iranensis]TFH72956.1 sugar ABC transporter permease [Cellulomonas sp. HD19AZ1]UCN13728.1 sugar ABC transporter permease [Cellulomonas iranensis]
MSSISENVRDAQGSPTGLAAEGGTVTVPPSAGRARGIGWRMRAEIALLAGPALIVFLAFVIFPVVMAAYYGFFSWQGFGPPTDFVGLRNYVTILTDPTFHDALRHNAFIMVMSLVMQGPIAIALALLLNRKMRGQSVIRVLIFVPYVISEVVVGTGWSLMLQTSGAVNDLLGKLGLEGLQRDWLSDPKIAIWTLMIIITWKYVGFAVILFLAGLQGIPEELSEAAAIDGASYWQVQRRITLPLLGPTLRIWAFLSIIGSLQLFDLVYIVWGQYVASTAGTSTMATYMVVNGRNAGSFGYGNAVAVVLFVISLIVALIYQRFVLRRDTEGATTGGKR